MKFEQDLIFLKNAQNMIDLRTLEVHTFVRELVELLWHSPHQGIKMPHGERKEGGRRNGVGCPRVPYAGTSPDFRASSSSVTTVPSASLKYQVAL